MFCLKDHNQISDAITYFEDFVQYIHQFLLCCYALACGPLHRVLFATFQLAEAAQVIDSQSGTLCVSVHLWLSTPNVPQYKEF